MNEPERVKTVVIGAGQSGLSVGYHLARRNEPFVILESNERVGDTWRNRWDSLRLFTPACYDGLVGMPFPAPSRSFPTKDAMADYLESYAQKFALPVRTGVTVSRLSKQGPDFVIETNRGTLVAEQVVVAMATFQRRRTPKFASELDPSITQLHSIDYRNLSQFQPGGVLVVGAGNSGAEIAIEAARDGRKTWLAGRDVGHVPFKIESTVGKWVLAPIVLRFVFHHVLTTKTPMGRKVRVNSLVHGGPLIRTRPNELEAAGVTRVPRMYGVQKGKPMLENGEVIDAQNVVWCTGFEPGFSWIDLPVFDTTGAPIHERGIAKEPGLYFCGLHFLFAMSSTMIHGAARDAEFIANAVTRRSVTAAPRLSA